MTDLSEFGVDVEDEEAEESTEETASSSGTGNGDSHQYRRGRCRAIAGGTRRCRSPCSDGDLCHTHGLEDDPLTIDSSPVRLVRWLGNVTGRSARCRAIKGDGERCENGCGPLESFCGTHEDVDDPDTVDELEDDELDVDLIRSALHGLVGLEDEPLSVTEDGLWLPKRFAAASRLIVRTPTKTVDSRLKGDWDQRRLATGITVDDWDSDYLDGEGRTAKIRNEKCLPDGDGPKVGLMIEGEDQRWFPVDVDGGESA